MFETKWKQIHRYGNLIWIEISASGVDIIFILGGHWCNTAYRYLCEPHNCSVWYSKAYHKLVCWCMYSIANFIQLPCQKHDSNICNFTSTYRPYIDMPTPFLDLADIIINVYIDQISESEFTTIAETLLVQLPWQIWNIYQANQVTIGGHAEYAYNEQK